MSSTSSYAGKTVQITGAARGIGAHTARRLHAGGAKVALVGLEPDNLEALTQELGTDRAAWWEADVTDFDALTTAVDAAAEHFGGIDVAIANAGVHYVGAFETSPLEQIERELEINLLGVIRTDKAVLPHLVKSGGYLLNIASLAAVTHAPLMTAYAASKAGVEAFTNALRQEMSVRGVDVGTAYFGFIDTDMVRDAFSNESTKVMEKLMPKFVSNSVPVSEAVDALERAVLKRSDRTWAPKYVGGAIGIRGVLQPLTEKRVKGSKTLKKALSIAESEVARAAEKVKTRS
ncbi:MAG: short-chain dehydrogenase/reductase [Solirubrobacteraceae bacterium]|nr:short-chain dehydrogenase/reductase [Solirubrobacteraceae bacterium]